MLLPFPSLDHVVINALDRMDAAAECYRRLGFSLTPRGRHTLGSINHLAVFGTDYLELVGVAPDAPKARADIRRFPAGLNGFVFGTEDPDTLYAALAASGVPAEAPIAFSRPVELPRGSEDARFRVVRLAAEAVPYGRLYFCNHLTRSLVWRDAWREHANGAVGMVRAAGVPNRRNFRVQSSAAARAESKSSRRPSTNSLHLQPFDPRPAGIQREAG